jgi:hypothetical protein
MNAMCIRCNAPGTVTFALDKCANFQCRACEESFTQAEVRQYLAMMNASWGPILAWLDAAPKISEGEEGRRG